MADTIWNLLCNSVYGLVMVNFKLTSRTTPVVNLHVMKESIIYL